MVNFLIIAIGQCGNQLSYELLNMIYDHCVKNSESIDGQKQKSHVTSKFSRSKTPRKDSTNKKTPHSRPYFHREKNDPSSINDDSQDILLSSLFRTDEPSLGDKSKTAFKARVVCLDTEPKVIQDCLEKAKGHFTPQSHYSWLYDENNVAYRHSGAGNNWALGYSIATGDFLELALEKIRREIERCDDVPILVYIHSLAGGTGSGLGTHLVESSYELFSNCFHYHVLVSPHSFSEVIVQYYNALLCLSKIYHNSDGILIFENENAQLLCKQMKFIEKPVLADLNHTIANHLVTLFLPKKPSSSLSSSSIHPRNEYEKMFLSDPHTSAGSYGNYNYLNDDLTYLCSNPNYRFFNVKITPQTSIDSIDFTYDSWFTLLNTIQRMQLSGTLSERHILPFVKQLGKKEDSPSHSTYTGGYRSKSKSQDDSHGLLNPIEEEGHEHSDSIEDYDIQALSHPPPKIPPPNPTYDSQLFQSPPRNHPQGKQLPLIKSVASIISCHGEGAMIAIEQLESQFREDSIHDPSQSSSLPISFESKSIRSSAQSMSGTTNNTSYISSQAYVNYHQNKPKLFEEYLTSHSTFHSFHHSSIPIQFSYSNFLLNQYQRSTTVISNDQSILPLLQRTIKRSSEMFQVKAYLHQYTTHGLEMDDFIDSFQSLGSVIQSYSDL